MLERGQTETKFHLAAIVMVSMLTPWLAHAAVLEEIIVTAQKREQSAQDVPIAVTALSGEQIEQLGYTNAQQVTAMAPGVSTVQPNGEANYAIAMRGVAASDFTTNIESPVAIYLDETYISQMSGTGFQLFDMERVEILRGPQGTLFGRNATGGLVHFLTKRPTEQKEGYFQVTGADYDTLRFEGAASGALSDNLLARLSVAVNNGNGYVTNRLGGKLNDTDDQSARLQLLYKVGDSSDVLLNVRGSRQNIATGFFENVSSVRPGELTPTELNPVLGYIDNDGDPYAGDYDSPGFNDLETFGSTITINIDFSNSTLTSISDYQTVKRDYIEDSDASPVPLFNFFLTTDAKQFSQEIRLTGGRDGLNWVGGIYYLDLDIDDSNGGETEPFVDPANDTPAVSGIDNPYKTKTESWSLFGQVDFDLSDTLALTVGARVINDKKKHTYAINAVDFIDGTRKRNGNPNILAPIASYAGKRDDTEWSGRLALNWRPDDDRLFYASWNRGVRSGGFNSPIFPVSPPLGYDDATFSYSPEILDAWEAGFKLSFSGGLARLNGAVYYYDYKDYQAFQIIGIDTITTNADAESTGFELELQASPGEGWDLMFGVGYNDIDVDLGNGTPKTTSVQSPKWNLNGLARYEWPAMGGVLAVQFDGQYRSEHFFALTGLETVRENGYTVYNTSVSYRSGDDRWTLRGFINNLSDEEYLVQTFDLSGPDVFGMTEQYYGRPRWWGVSVSMNW